MSGCLAVISRVTILLIYVVLGHLYTVFHCPDLPRLAPSTLLSSHMMYTLLVVGMVYLESQGCVWVVSYDLLSDCLVIYVCLGHVYTVFHYPDLPILDPSPLIRSYIMHLLLMVYMVYLDCQGCVWVLSCDLKSDDFGDIRVLRSFVHPISLPRPETHPYRPPVVLCGVHTRTSGSGVFAW